ncbi:putative O-glycosylation ligase, exosortase A system-associated [Gayadomonas joobiniege]|uniref:putative O-glycosylation ligase, exosortase A system-associated n=1 Tax=Gayadomonas joobiniege TaxID=1234606 RepID=UPI0003826F30|nr:putative O-glycosylation ligase, exosortase A system-associated [Gayadomonas joobiniege]
MISDLFALAIISLFIIFGFKRPYVALSGLIWIDNFRPQELSVSFLNGKPLSALFTAYFLLVLLINLRQVKFPSSIRFYVLNIFFLIWITLTTVYSHYPELAWLKHDSAFKIILSAFFIPLVLVDRRSTEMFLWVNVITFGTLSFFAGVKTLLGGGGYGVNLIGTFGGSFWSEGSTLAAMTMALVPLCLILVHSQLANWNKKLNWVLWGYAFCGFLTVVGTQARTGIVCIIVFVLLQILKSEKKLRGLAIALIFPLILIPFVPDSFLHRANTIESSENAAQDTSAMGRVAVWLWTLDYSLEHPIMGGGFFAYRDNAGELAQYSGSEFVTIDTPYPKAWHNMIIEVLGTQGYVGLLVFLCFIASTLFARLPEKDPQLNTNWRYRYNSAIKASLLIFCAGGMFVNIAFYPWIYYMFGISIALKNQQKLADQAFNNANKTKTPYENSY